MKQQQHLMLTGISTDNSILNDFSQKQTPIHIPGKKDFPKVSKVNPCPS
jgi:hypothetical protein